VRTLALAALLAAVPIVDRPGTWTLAELGAGRTARIVQADRGFAFRWRGPAGLRQGAHHRWYFVHFHGRVLVDLRRTTFEAAGEIASSSGPGSGYTCASDRVDEYAAGDSYVYSWYSGPGVVEVTGAAAQPVLLVDDTTACMSLGVRPGVNTVHLQARGFGEHARLVVLPDSGIVVASSLSSVERRPPRVALTIRPPTKVHAGETVDLHVEAGSPGATLTVTAPRGPVRVLGPTSLHVSHRVVHTFRLRTTAAGRAWVLVRAGGERRLVVLTIH
jgi:hypothetical protein